MKNSITWLILFVVWALLFINQKKELKTTKSYLLEMTKKYHISDSLYWNIKNNCLLISKERIKSVTNNGYQINLKQPYEK